MNRRSFLGGGAAVVVLPLVGCRPWMRRNEAPEASSEHEVATLRAMALMFVPAGAGSPGADDVDAVKTILDPSYGAAGYVTEVVSDLDDWCFVRHGAKRFVDLSPAGREQALEERMGLRGRLIASWYRPVYEGIAALTKLAFFGGLNQPAGVGYVGFPGASTGYAPSSAAGTYHAAAAAIAVVGDGRVSAVRIGARGAGKGGARLHAPDGSVHAVAAGDAVVVASAVGVVAAGTWRLELDGLAWWSLTVRTDLDEVAAASVARDPR